MSPTNVDMFVRPAREQGGRCRHRCHQQMLTCLYVQPVNKEGGVATDVTNKCLYVQPVNKEGGVATDVTNKC